VIVDEAATSEAIHASAHPGRKHDEAEADAAESESDADGAADAGKDGGA
jgi:hypothetical protein